MPAFTIERARRDGTDLVDHFATYASKIRLDTGEFWPVEGFQLEVAEPILRGVPEVWTLIPEGNTKTTLLAGLGLYLCDYSVQPWIPIMASSRDQAEIMAQQAYGMVRETPGMDRRFKVQEGHKRILPIRPDHPGRTTRGLKVYAADVGTSDGGIPYPVVLCDEGHRWPNMGVYRLWKGKLDKREDEERGRLVTIAMISTAGEPGTEFEQMRDSIRDSAQRRKVRSKAHIRYESDDDEGLPAIVMNEWMVRDVKDAKDPEVVKAANPFSGVKVAKLRAALRSPTTDFGDFLRLKCNIAARGAAAAISDAEWQAAELVGGSIPAGAMIDFGLDVAWQHDTTAAVPLWRTGDGELLLGDAMIVAPPVDGSMLRPDELKAELEEQLLDRFTVDAVVMDMTRAQEIAAWLEDEHGCRVIHWPQGNAQAILDYEAFMRELRNGTLHHTGHNGLRAHVMHAVARRLPGDKRRFDRPSQSRHQRKQDLRVIDALDAAAMVVSHASGKNSYELAGDVSDYRISSFG